MIIMKKLKLLCGVILLSSCLLSCEKNTVNTKIERQELNYSTVLRQMRSIGYVEIMPAELGCSVENFLTPNYSEFKIFKKDSDDYFIVTDYERRDDYLRAAAECDKFYSVNYDDDGNIVSFSCAGEGNTCAVEIYTLGPNDPNIHFNIIVCHAN